MANESKSTSIGIFGLLGVAFVILKLCKVITWSWWWVTAPFWGPLALFIIVIPAFCLLMAAITGQLKSK